MGFLVCVGYVVASVELGFLLGNLVGLACYVLLEFVEEVSIGGILYKAVGD